MTKNTTVTDLIKRTEETAIPAVRPDKLKMKRKLTMDVTSISRLGQVVCRVDGEFEMMTMPQKDANGEQQQATGVPITDVITGSQYLLICNALIVSAFQRAGEPLTGRYFALRSGEIKAGKRYRSVDVMELELAAE